MTRHIVMLGTSPETMGGISSVVNEYVEAGLFKRFPVVYIATHRDGGIQSKAGRFASAWLRYLGMLIRGQVALVHVHVASDASFWRKSLFFLPTFLARRPSILHLHGAQFDRFYGKTCGAIGRSFVRFVFRHVDVVIVLSGFWEQWARVNLGPVRIACIANSVRLQPQDGARRERATILFLGRLGERKGTYDLVAAAAGLLGRHPDLRLVLGGDGEQERVASVARELGMTDKVEVPGWVSGTRKAELLGRASIYALPSYAEGLPVSVLEAMAAGLPVISTPVGGIPELVADGSTGCLVAPGDVEGLRKAIDKLLDDDQLRLKMAEAARKKVQESFSTEQIIPRIEALYTELGRRE